MRERLDDLQLLSTGLCVDTGSCEYLLVGGGLQNSLIALALLEQRPETRLTLIEREPELGRRRQDRQ